MRKLKMGMVGGGRGAFIGAVHRMATALDGQIELVAGAFSSNPETSSLSGRDLFLDPARVYGTYTEMYEREAALSEDERMDFVCIVTPNHVHHPAAKAALLSGFPVACDKPISLDVAEALDLDAIVKRTGLPFLLTHNYTGYPLVKEARERISRGDLGAIRKVVVEYPQGWLSEPIEQSGQKQADWRTDPARSGAAGCMGDIGTHAFNLAEYITSLEVSELAADLTAMVPGRRLDDDGNVLLRFHGGAKGLLQASQISFGEENGLHIRVYGEKGGFQWRQDEPNTLVYFNAEGRHQIRTGVGSLSSAAQKHTRIPAGHPEGYLEAFANLYRNFAHKLRADKGEVEIDSELDYPSTYAGLRGMQFIEAAVASSAANAAWTQLSS